MTAIAAIHSDIYPGPRVVGWCCAGVLTAWMFSGYVYKTWYIATAMATIVVVLGVLFGRIRTRGLLRRLLPVLAYFGALALTALWAAHPRTVVRWVVIDLIEVFIFALFFLFGKNLRPAAIIGFLIVLVVPVVLSTFFYALTAVNPIERFGSPGTLLLPLLVPFQWMGWRWLKRKWWATVSMATGLAFVAISLSRTPIAVEALLIGLSVVAFSRDLVMLLRNVMIAVVAVVALITVLLLIPPTRALLITSYDRMLQKTVVYSSSGDVLEQDFERNRIREGFDRLLPQYFPRGIGYENFLDWYEAEYGYAVPLHSTFETWILEGGIACLLVVAILLGGHVARLNRVRRRSRDRLDRDFAKALLIATVDFLAFGLFHQVHQTPLMWMILGTSSGFARQARA